MRVLMSGGGTAGHVYPALAVAAVLASERDEVLFVGTPDGLEARLVPIEGIEYVALPARGFDRSKPWTLITSSALIAMSTVRAWLLLRSKRPDVVIGFGGYVSIPVGFAAVMARVPLVLHEQNSVPGLANKVLSRFAGAVGVTYEESAAFMSHPERAVVTGNPVRDSVLESDAAAGRQALELPSDAIVLLVFGGSRGARHINSAVLALRDRLMAIADVHVIHVAGRTEAAATRAALQDAGGDAGGRWSVREYIEDMGGAIAAADLIVARAGATSIAEITALGRAAVLVPYPYATDDHQTKNARVCAEHGAAVVMADAEIDAQHFGDTVVRLLGDEGARATMAAASRALGRPDAAARVAELARRAMRTRQDPDPGMEESRV